MYQTGKAITKFSFIEAAVITRSYLYNDFFLSVVNGEQEKKTRNIDMCDMMRRQW